MGSSASNVSGRDSWRASALVSGETCREISNETVLVRAMGRSAKIRELAEDVREVLASHPDQEHGDP